MPEKHLNSFRNKQSASAKARKSLYQFSRTTLAALVLSACNTVSSNGPLTRDVVGSSANELAELPSQRPYVYGLLNINEEVIRSQSEFKSQAFAASFRTWNEKAPPLIGVGDELEITIFEAGPDGLFSTNEKKSVTFRARVQSDGTAPVPYIGEFSFSGKTIRELRREIGTQLRDKAVEPDLIISLLKNDSRKVTINGAVQNSSVIALGPQPERIMDIIARAGGITGKAYETFVDISRGAMTSQALIQNLIDEPERDIYALPGDKLFLTVVPKTFSVLGATGRLARIPFDSERINLIEAAALAAGANVNLADPQGFFIFRYEALDLIIQILGDMEVERLLNAGWNPDEEGYFPVVYQIDMSDPSSFLIGQSFYIQDDDVIYLARHPSTDITRFLQFFVQPFAAARTITGPQ